jgi:hypothetical protein
MKELGHVAMEAPKSMDAVPKIGGERLDQRTLITTNDIVKPVIQNEMAFLVATGQNNLDRTNCCS